MLNIIFCVTLRTLPTTLKGVNMEFEIELYELDDMFKFIVEWEYDPEYSPKEGIYNKFFWSLYLLVGTKRMDITNELSDKDRTFIEKQIEEICCE